MLQELQLPSLGNPLHHLQSIHVPQLPWRKESSASKLQHVLSDASNEGTAEDAWRARILRRAGRLNPLEYGGVAAAITFGLTGAYKALSPQVC